MVLEVVARAEHGEGARRLCIARRRRRPSRRVAEFPAGRQRRRRRAAGHEVREWTWPQRPAGAVFCSQPSGRPGVVVGGFTTAAVTGMGAGAGATTVALTGIGAAGAGATTVAVTGIGSLPSDAFARSRACASTCRRRLVAALLGFFQLVF